MRPNTAGEVVQRFYEEFGAGNLDAALSACADDLEIIDPGMGQVRGRDRFREYLETFKRAMPDARAVVEQMLESGEAVAVEGRLTGTHTGPRRPMMATSNQQGLRSTYASQMSRVCATGRSLPTTPTTTSSGCSPSSGLWGTAPSHKRAVDRLCSDRNGAVSARLNRRRRPRCRL
jgi:ketosteroid isomerase-like protein